MVTSEATDRMVDDLWRGWWPDLRCFRRLRALLLWLALAPLLLLQGGCAELNLDACEMCRHIPRLEAALEAASAACTQGCGEGIAGSTELSARQKRAILDGLKAAEKVEKSLGRHPCEDVAEDCDGPPELCRFLFSCCPPAQGGPPEGWKLSLESAARCAPP